jgi:hypothetical protein
MIPTGMQSENIFKKLTNMISVDVEGLYYKRNGMLFKELVDIRDKNCVL